MSQAPTTPIPMLSTQFAQQHGVCFALHKQQLTLYRCATTPASIVMECQRIAQQLVCHQLVSDQDFQKHLQNAIADSQNHQAMAADISAQHNWSDVLDTIESSEDLLDNHQDAPVIQLINGMIQQALQQRASDIHLECYTTQTMIRIRVDGTLQTLVALPARLAPLLISRIKIMAKLDIAQKRLPQDGRMRVRMVDHNIDIRVATLPAQHGERLVLRILDQNQTNLSLAALGMTPAQKQTFEQLLHRRHGMILLTGPTGSGKTTTLYAALKAIHNGKQNILTVEDPIEYDLPGIGQSAVNEKTGYHFANGLRAILRQDPDVVMVGEIRDPETANMATQASLTGHLVLATLHTHTAAGAIQRLMHMQVEPFFIAHGLLAVINQRLLRILCSHCKQATSLQQEEAQRFQLPPTTAIYQAQGCDQCSHTGYHGRQAVYEILHINNHCQQLIRQQASESEIDAYANQQRCGMLQSAIALLASGKTSLTEVLSIHQTTEVPA